MVHRLPALAVAATGFFLYLLTAYPFPNWLDSPELSAAAFRLGVFHPPGSPLAVILGHLFCLWPFAHPATSLLYFSALFAALALYVLTRTVQDLWKALGPDDKPSGVFFAVMLGGAFMLCNGLWSQAVRTEVYTLALLLLLCALRDLMRLAASPDEAGPDRVVRAAAFTGMGLGVHPLIALAVAPAILALVVWKDTRVILLAPRNLLRAAAAGLLGLAPLLLIPLMADTPGDLRWGDPATLTGWLKTVLGLTFSHSFTRAQSPGTGLTALVAIISGLGLGLSTLAALGLYPLMRKKPCVAVLLVCTGTFCLLTLALQRSVRLDNPDVSGYALPAMAALLLLAAGGLAAGSRILAGVRARLAWTAPALALLALTATILPPDSQRLNRSTCTAGRRLAVRALGLLPDRSVAVVADFNLAFMLDYLIQVEGHRPDVRVFYLRDLDNPALRRALAQEDQELEARLPRADRLDGDSVARLGELRPVALDGGPHLGTGLLSTLTPRGLFWLSGRGEPPAERQLICEARSFHADLRGAGDPRTRDVIAWHAYWQSRGAEQLGLLDLSRTLLDAARRMSPHDRTIGAAARRLGPPPVFECESSPQASLPTALPRRPPVLPALILLLGLLAWAMPLCSTGPRFAGTGLRLAVGLAGLVTMAAVLWLA
jgi:hypothetical protein